MSQSSSSLPLRGAHNPSSLRAGTTPGSFANAPNIGGALAFSSPDTPGMPQPSSKTAWDFMPSDWTLVDGRWTPPAGFETGASAASEDWMSVCDAGETQCLTIASFAPAVKTLVQGRHYVTALGRFALGRSFDKTWDVFLFPCRFDEVVAGRSVREWIYVLRREG